MTATSARPAGRTSDASTARRNAWVPGADGLRAVAAVLVFVHHSSFLTGATFQSRAGGLYDRFDVGVSVFFALSGFLLGRPYIAALLDGTALPEKRAYFRRRLLRIIPAYWVALTATYVWLKPDSAKDASGVDMLLNYLLLQIYPNGTFTKGISAAWTLAVEMSFYVALPFAAVAAARLLRRCAGPSQRAVLLLGVLTALGLFGFVWRGLVHGLDLPLQIASWLPGSMPPFAVGLGFAVLAVWSERREVARPAVAALGRYDLLWWTLAALLLVFSSSQLGLARGLAAVSWNREVQGEVAHLLVAALLLLPVAFGPADRGLVRRFLRSWPLAKLGIVSYGLFLWHVPIIERSIRWTDRQVFLDWSTPGMGTFSADVLEPVGLALLLSVLLGTASWFLVEKPLARWRQLRPRDPAPVVEQAAP